MKTISKVIVCLGILLFTTSYILAQNTFPETGNVGIGTVSPGAKLGFTNVDGTDQADGITWYNPAPLYYGIYRTGGTWTSPDYQQLKLNWETGIALNPGSIYGKSYVDIQGGGLRVTSGRVGIGTISPGAKLGFNDLNDGSDQADGITWFNPSPLSYGIYRTAGAWSAPDYQQLQLQWETGITLNPGSLYGKSYVDIQGGGLRVTSGKVGIGTVSPGAKIGFTNIDATSQADGITWYNPAPQNYGIYRTEGGWISPNYQQLKLNWETGITLNPGSLYGKSYVDIQGGGLRVTSGSVAIGTGAPVAGYSLTVENGILTEKVKIALKSSSDWSDYVFGQSYKLRPLSEVETFVNKNKHLPGVPSADELIKEGGVNVNEMFAKQMEKIEELTLYLIEIKKENELMIKRVEQLEKENKNLKSKTNQ